MNKTEKGKPLPWVEKYRPKKITDIIGHDDIINKLKSCIDKNDLPHMLFYGPPGTGKTSSILAIARDIYGPYYKDYIYELNASDDRGIDTVRKNIKSYARLSVNKNAVLPDGRTVPPYKIIILDEADAMTKDAQDALRVIIEKNCSVTRFCFICNYIKQIIVPIKSRCAMFEFQPIPINKMVEKLADVAEKENIKYESDEVLFKISEIAAGDMRRGIMMLQNLKYIYDSRMKINNFIDEEDIDLRYISVIINYGNNKIKPVITVSDVLDISGMVHRDKCIKYIIDCINSENIKNVKNISQEIMSSGYSVDIVIRQMNECLMNAPELSKYDIKKRMEIIRDTMDVQRRIKENGDPYLQLLLFMTTVHYIINK